MYTCLCHLYGCHLCQCHLSVSPVSVTWLRAHLYVLLPNSVTFYSESQIMRWRDRLLEVLGTARRVKDSFAFVHRAEVVDRELLGRRDSGREEGEGSQWTHNGPADRDRPGAIQLLPVKIGSSLAQIVLLQGMYVT